MLQFCRDNGITSEVKWNNINESVEQRFCNFVDIFFDFVEDGRIKVRVMFTQNRYRPLGLTREHIRQQYFLLYYQFIKHGLGLQFYSREKGERGLQLICDQFPDTSSQVEEFRRYLLKLNNNHFRRQGLVLDRADIGEAKSHQHMILQGTDLVLGAIQFKLNAWDKAKPEGKNRRGKKTRAKERVYKHILSRIQRVYPNFNIGISTGTQGDIRNRWIHPYRHWILVPADHEVDHAIKK